MRETPSSRWRSLARSATALRSSGGSSTTASPRYERISPTSHSALPTGFSATAEPSASGDAPFSTSHPAISLQYQMRAGRASRNSCGSKPSRGSKCPRWRRAERIRSSLNERSASRVRSPVCTYPYGRGRARAGRAPRERVRLDEVRRELVLAFLEVVDLDEAPLVRAAAQRRDEVLLGALDVRLRGLHELELAEGLLELRADAPQRRASVGGDHRADELQREPNRAGLERGQPWGCAEGVAVQLLVDAHGVAAQLGVDRVAAAAEVDEIQQREVLLELLLRDVEPLDEVGRRDLGVDVVAALVQEVGEQCLQHREPLRVHRGRRPLHLFLVVPVGLGSQARRLLLVLLADELERSRELAAQLLGLAGNRPPVVPQHPRREQPQARILGHEDAVLDTPAASVGALHPPGGVAADLDARLADGVADLPRGPAAILVDVQLGRQAEVPLAAGGEADLAANSRDPERALVLGLEILADDVPGARVLEERVGVDRPLALLVARDRPVRELDRALLRDGGLELAQPALHLGGVLGVEHLDAHRRLCRRLGETRATESEVLQREAKRLRVGELAFEQVQRGLQRGELVVRQLQRGEEVPLGAHVVELLAGVLVALRGERHAEALELRAVGVEPPRERLVGHLLVALDARLDLARGDGTPLRHQERDQRELADQLVGVVAQVPRAYRLRCALSFSGALSAITSSKRAPCAAARQGDCSTSFSTFGSTALSAIIARPEADAGPPPPPGSRSALRSTTLPRCNPPRRSRPRRFR